MKNHSTPHDRYAFIDAARGAAALAVLLAHGIAECVPAYRQWYPSHAELGLIGVILFLVVSGFIIPVSLEKAGSNTRFWVRRAFRLFPAYWLSIGVAFVFVSLGGQIGIPLTPLSTWLFNCTMLQGFLNQQNVWGVFWTLQVELMIYAACSILFALRLLDRWWSLSWLALLGFGVLGLAWPFPFGRSFVIGGFKFLFFAPLIGFLTQRHMAGKLSKAGLYLWLASFAFMIGAVWTVNHVRYPAQVPLEILRSLTWHWAPALTAFLVLFEMRNWRIPATVCWFGRISYSVYLFHPVVLFALMPTRLPPGLFLCSLLAATLLLSELVYRLVEIPGIAMGKQVERWWLSTKTDKLADGQSSRRAA